ncbi:hypothetical protein ACMXYQ_11730 [Neptuniibacter sp. PT34_22]|uniref:hypothetical protein n=1 Tax=Neptuniibacter sp. PT34_22 TaxID=3398205 RepID=UPI0039F5D742
MNEFLVFLASPAGKIIAASGVIAALITSVFNVVNIRMTNRRLIEVESARQGGEVLSFRYTKLYELFEEFNRIPSVTYDLSNMKKLVQDTTDRFHSIERIFERAEPLISKALLSEAMTVRQEANELSRKMVEHVHGNGQDVSLKELMQKRQEFDELAKNAISSGLRALTNQ